MRIWENAEQIPANARLCLYGAGDFGIALCRLLRQQRPDVTISCFCDTYKTGEREGVKIVSPDELKGKIDADTLILITSFAYREQIATILRNLGLVNFFALHPLFNALSQSTSDKAGQMQPAAGETLYAFYDLSVSPPGFDIANFLYLAEQHRLRSQCARLHVLIVPRPNDALTRQGMNYEIGQMQDEKTFQWWLHNIIVPCCRLVPACKDISVCPSREVAGVIRETVAKSVYPPDYTVSSPVEGYSWKLVMESGAQDEGKQVSLRATPKAIDFLNLWKKSVVPPGREVVTITLKESARPSKRDSDIAEWIKFARRLDQKLFLPVIVRDTSASLQAPLAGTGGLVFFNEASWNLELRMALYETGYINMFVANGPAIMCSFNRHASCLIFNFSNEDNFIFSAASFLEAGLAPGSQLPYLTRFQKIIWEQDRCEVLEREFALLQESLRSSAARGGD